MRDTVERTEMLDALTRQEWNAAYFLGLESMFRERGPTTFLGQMEEGYQQIIQADVSPTRREVATSQLVGSPPPPGEHRRACGEILDGTFDLVERARDALGWIDTHLPWADTEWLRALLSLYDDAHPGDPRQLHEAWEEPGPTGRSRDPKDASVGSAL